MTSYGINDVYRSVQGEGARQGSHNVFVRFRGCNMRCEMKAGPKSPGGFDCDTEFESGSMLTIGQLIDRIIDEDIANHALRCNWVILTGGEPGLQINDTLIDALHDNRYSIAVETNGSIELPDGLAYIAVSPKVAEHCIRQRTANEVRYVRGYGQALPKTVVQADHYFISPAFLGEHQDPRAVQWCEQLCEGTKWKLSLQTHKTVGDR